MAHYPKPFYRAPRGVWYVQIDGKQHNLGPDKDAAFKTYHGLMQQRAEPPAAMQLASVSPLVISICDDFLDWCEKQRAPETYRWYKDRLESFCKTIEATLTADALRPYHVQKWVDNYGIPLKSGSRRNLIASVKRAMKWAEEQGYIDHSRIALMKKPACGRKEQVVTPEQFNALLDRYDDQEFRDLLIVTWETGCRPQESLRVEARHVDLAGSRWVFPASESKGKKIPRVVYLTPKALEINTRLIQKHPNGPIFLNTDGKPWDSNATNCRFQTVRQKTGVKYSLYALRHSFATHALMKGVDCITVATLLGHADPSMLSKTYQHISQSPAYMQQQLQRAVG